MCGLVWRCPCITIAAMSFERDIVEAQIALGLIASHDMPKVAWDALEFGLDGPAIRRLAALDFPTYFEVRDILPRAMKEMGLVEIDKRTAALRLARIRAQAILESGDDLLIHTKDFERLWIDAGYPRELTQIGNLDDEVFIASGSQSDDELRELIAARLSELIRNGEPT